MTHLGHVDAELVQQQAVMAVRPEPAWGPHHLAAIIRNQMLNTLAWIVDLGEMLGCVSDVHV